MLPIGASVIAKLGQLRFITNWGKCYYKIGATSFYYKLEQVLLQIGAAFLLQIGASVITNWGSLINTNQGKFYYKSGQLLKIRATVITN